MAFEKLRQLLDPLDEELAFPGEPHSDDPLKAAWRDAARTARDAYDEWLELRDHASAVGYLAAADRADAAQDALAARAAP
jgi:hypothetical protein